MCVRASMCVCVKGKTDTEHTLGQDNDLLSLITPVKQLLFPCVCVSMSLEACLPNVCVCVNCKNREELGVLTNKRKGNKVVNGILVLQFLQSVTEARLCAASSPLGSKSFSVGRPFSGRGSSAVSLQWLQNPC